jgi:DNA (cytosine-5)-methyltransferase 1
VLSDLESIGYSCQTFDIPACAVDAPHVRHRIWIVAHSECNGRGSWGTECEGQRRRTASVGASIADVAHSPLRENDGRERGIVEGEERGGVRVHAAAYACGEDVAHADRTGCGEKCGSESIQSELPATQRGSRWLPEPELGRVAHGISRRVDRLRSLGNAVVPQLVEVIGRAIMEAEKP